MISVKNKNIVNSFDKIQPGEARLERILSTAYKWADSGESSVEKVLRRTIKWKRLVPLTACLVGAIALSTFALSMVAEAKEYKEAVSFFGVNELTTHGLTRAEIKEVYRDITTGRFSSNKTAEILEKRVGGYEIAQNVYSKNDLENLWNSLKNAHLDSAYRIAYNESLDSNLGFDVLQSSDLNRVDSNGRVIWSATFDNLYIDRYVAHGEYVAVYGYEPTWSSAAPTIARVGLVRAGDGAVLWDDKLPTKFNWVYVKDVVFDADEITVFAEGDFKTAIILKYDQAGLCTVLAENILGGNIRQVVNLSDGYLARLGTVSGEERLVKISSDGTLTDVFAYSANDTEYFIVDMADFGGRVYLSTYAVPKLREDESSAGGRVEIAAILNEIFESQVWEVPTEELTKRMREHFSAVLLVCDTNSGIPQEFYSVSGSIGDVLKISDEGNLTWDVGGITDSLFSPATSSFTLAATCLVHRYEFDPSGNLISQGPTGEAFDFRR